MSVDSVPDFPLFGWFHPLTGEPVVLELARLQPEQVCFKQIDARLCNLRRFTARPQAMTVHQHRSFCLRLSGIIMYLSGRLKEDTWAFVDGTGRRLYPAIEVSTKGTNDDDEWIRLRKLCYFHDNHEAFIGDIPAPVKAFLRAGSPDLDVLSGLETGIDYAIHTAAGLGLPTDWEHQRIKIIDEWAASLEMSVLMNIPLPPSELVMHSNPAVQMAGVGCIGAALDDAVEFMYVEHACYRDHPDPPMNVPRENWERSEYLAWRDVGLDFFNHGEASGDG